MTFGRRACCLLRALAAGFVTGLRPAFGAAFRFVTGLRPAFGAAFRFVAGLRPAFGAAFRFVTGLRPALPGAFAAGRFVPVFRLAVFFVACFAVRFLATSSPFLCPPES